MLLMRNKLRWDERYGRKVLVFMALVRAQAVILQSTCLMHCFPISKGVYEAAICPYVGAAPLRRNLRTISFITHPTIPHFTYQFAPSKSGRPSPWSTAICFNSPPEVRRIKQPLTLLNDSETPHHPSVSVSLSSPSTW